MRTADVVITMGYGDTCLIYPGKRYLDWNLPDPAGKTLEEVSPIRDEIDARVRALLAELIRSLNPLTDTRRQWRPAPALTPL